VKALKRIVLTGGGTAGHVTPNLALIPSLRKMGYEIHYIGTKNGIEHTLIAEEKDVIYHSVQSGKLRRYFSWQNFIDPFKVVAGAFQSAFLIAKIKPDILFSKGGFVAFPAVFGAWLSRTPVICHESDLTPGLSNKLCKPFAKIICTTFPECAKAVGKKGLCTGTPLRASLFEGSREKGLALGGFDGKKPVLLMTGGSQGAQSVNKALRAILQKLTPQFDILHLCGKGNLDASLEGVSGYRQLEYLSDGMNDALAAADIVLSRAGSNTLCELQALKKPSLLIPYPKGSTSRGDQVLNAESFAARSLALVLSQSEMTPDSLYESIMRLWDKKDEIKKNLENAPAANGTDAILRLISQNAKQRKA
jgi:UDP-N-acetylglucosamine--N-acetylmuramyl-(pentapeptide) pyrophosphoryl-undecaprenol N-acetylglucosamine transferase